MPNALSFRSLLRRLLTVCVTLAAATAPLFAQSPSAADGFDPNVNGNIYAAVVDSAGRIILGGEFSTVQPNGAVFSTPRSNLVRLNPDGSVDATFDVSVNAPVRALVLQPDGALVIGGDFTAINGAARNRVARLAASGALDAAFSPGFTGDLQPQVFALARQADGAILVGGSFTRATSSGSTAVVARRNLARVSAAGVVDPAYNPNPNGLVLALALHSGGRVVVGGGFTTFQENGAATATTRNRLARLNPNGTLDPDFNPNANNGVAALAVQRDGKILVGGFFTTLQTVGWDTAVPRSYFARLNDDGTLDAAFESNASGSVKAIAVQPDGGILIGGTFTAVWSKGSTTFGKSFVARFLPDATIDTSFNAGVNAEVSAIVVQADAKVVLGGYFTRVFPFNTGGAGVLTRNRVARIYPNGEFDATLQLDAGGRPLVSAVQSDGKVILGGSFTSVGGATHASLARVNADGTVDASYNPTFDSRVLGLALQADGKLVVVGTFLNVNGVARNRIARLNVDGTLDTGFNPNADGAVGAVTLQSDGKILVGGAFNTLQPPGATAVVIRPHVARLNADGTVDAFDPSADNTVTSIVVQSDGKIVLAGAFTAFQPNGTGAASSRGHFARVNADGTLDTAFHLGFDAQISAMALQSDGKIVVGGVFTQVAAPGDLAATPRHRLARVNADGTLDKTFDPNANGNVLAVALQSDGKILVGGAFTTLQPAGDADWTLRKYAARLNADGKVDATFNLDINEQAGNRVDSLRVLADGRVLIGGLFSSLQPIGATRVARANFARLTAAGQVDTTFTLGAGGSTGAIVNALAVQTDGRVVVAGSFSDLGGAKTTNIARFTAAGLADASFGTTLTTDGAVTAVAIRPNAAAGAPQLAGFAWLNANGSLRTAFSADANARLAGQINAVVFDSAGRLLVGGAFTNRTNVTNGNLLRFSATGVLDTSFNPSINGQVTALALQADGKIIIGGTFTTVNTVTRNRLARLNADGSLDTGYDPNASSNVHALVLQADGKAVVAGAFTTFTPNAATTATTRQFLARLNTDGTLDGAYNPAPSANVNALVLQPDGKVVAGGAFTFFTPNGATTATNRNYLARVNADGTLDSGFDPNFNGAINALALQASGDLVVGGTFTSFEPTVNGTKVTGFPATNLARVRSDGSPDRGFNPVPNASVNAVALQPDGAILVAGDFTSLRPNGGASTAITRNHLARLNSDGSLDIAFNPDVTGSVFFVAARPDNTVLVGGNFTALQGNGLILVGGAFDNIGGVAARRLALLNDDGSINSSFLPNPNGLVNALAVLGDGRFYVGGAFTTIAGAARNGVARFNANGTLDATFNPALNFMATALAVQPDGKVLVGGLGRLVRLNADGTADGSFSYPANFDQRGIRRLALQPDGKILVAGTGTVTLAQSPSFGFVDRHNSDGSPDASFPSIPLQGAVKGEAIVVRDLTLQADGRILVATSRPTDYLTRFNSDGTRDASFNPNVNNTVTALAIQADGRVVIGGSFTQVGVLPRVGLARLATTGASVQDLAVTADRTTVLWTQGGTAAELSSVTFERSSDGATWNFIGNGQRISGNVWRLAGQQLPASGNFYLRARGIAPSSAGASSGIYESTRQFNYTAATFAVPMGDLAPGTVADGGSGNATLALGVDPFTGFALGQIPALLASASATNPGNKPADPGTVFTGRLANISTRGRVTADAPIILGFAITGTAPQTVLLRGAGPTLARFGVDGAAAQPVLRLYDDKGAVLLENTNWAAAPATAEAAARTGAFAFETGSRDAAMVATLAPGTYSIHLLSGDAAGGIALAEIYDASTAAQAADGHIVNLSSRGTAGVGGEAFIGGLVIAGNATQDLLVRGIGPTLGRYGVANTLTDPSVSVYDSQNRLVATNDNWSAALPDGAMTPSTAALVSASSAAGAFGLDVGSKDSALLITLSPGAYTIIINGPSGSTGAAMIEVYDR